MSKCKFEDAFCSKSGRIIDIAEASDLYASNPAEYKKISNNLYCPECKKAKLSFVNGSTKYFRTFKGSLHNENCSLSQELMSVKQTADFIANTENRAAILRQIASAMAVLFNDNSKRIIKKTNVTELDETQTITGFSTNYKKRKRIARKRIDLPFSDEDFNAPKIFYGKVCALWEKTNTKYKLLMYSLKTNKLVCKIFVTEKVYQYIPDKYKFEKSIECAISFLATFQKREEAYHITNLEHSDFLKINFIYITDF